MSSGAGPPLRSAGILGPHPPTLPTRPPKGLAAVTATATSTNVLTRGFAFGPSPPPPRSRPILRPLLTAPPRAPASRPAPSPPHPTNTTTEIGHPRTPVEIPRIRPAASPARLPHLHGGLLMTTGFAIACWLTQTAPPPMPFVSLRPRATPPASFPPRLTTTQSPSACLRIISATEDSHPQPAAHAGRTREKALGLQGLLGVRGGGATAMTARRARRRRRRPRPR